MNFRHEQLNAEIARSGKSKIEIAAGLGVHKNTVLSWTGGKVEPSLSRLVDLLLFIGWSDIQIRGSSLGEWYNVTSSNGGGYRGNGESSQAPDA